MGKTSACSMALRPLRPPSRKETSEKPSFRMSRATTDAVVGTNMNAPISASHWTIPFLPPSRSAAMMAACIGAESATTTAKYMASPRRARRRVSSPSVYVVCVVFIRSTFLG
jgi:hypothetical protein